LNAKFDYLLKIIFKDREALTRGPHRSSLAGEDKPTDDFGEEDFKRFYEDRTKGTKKESKISLS
jgi:hypothetical protein